MTLFLLHAICCYGNDMVQMRNVSESHSFPNFRSKEPQPSRSLGATCSLNPWPDTCWFFFRCKAYGPWKSLIWLTTIYSLHENYWSVQDDSEREIPIWYVSAPPLSRDILYWLRPQKLKGWLYFVLRFYHIIYRYVRIYFIYLHHAEFSMFANQATIAQMFPHAAQGGRRGCRYFWEWAFPKGFLGKTWNPGSNVNGDIRLEFTDHGIKSDESGDVAHSCEHIQKTGHPSICPFTAE